MCVSSSWQVLVLWSWSWHLPDIIVPLDGRKTSSSLRTGPGRQCRYGSQVSVRGEAAGVLGCLTVLT